MRRARRCQTLSFEEPTKESSNRTDNKREGSKSVLQHEKGGGTSSSLPKKGEAAPTIGRCKSTSGRLQSKSARVKSPQPPPSPRSPAAAAAPADHGGVADKGSPRRQVSDMSNHSGDSTFTAPKSPAAKNTSVLWGPASETARKMVQAELRKLRRASLRSSLLTDAPGAAKLLDPESGSALVSSDDDSGLGSDGDDSDDSHDAKRRGASFKQAMDNGTDTRLSSSVMPIAALAKALMTNQNLALLKDSDCALASLASNSHEPTKAQAVAAASGQLDFGSEEEQPPPFSAIPLLHACRPEFVEALAGCLLFRQFGPATIVLAAGFTCSSLLVVQSGSLVVLAGSDLCAAIETGGYFGEAHLLGIDDRSRVTLLSKEPVTVGELERTAFLTVLRDFHQEFRYFENITHKHATGIAARAGVWVDAIPVFNGLAYSVLERLDRVLVHRLYFQGQHICNEREPDKELFLLVAGVVAVSIVGRIVRRDRNDQEQKVDRDPEDKRGGKKVRGSILSSSNKVTLALDYGNNIVCYGELGLLGLEHSRPETLIADCICHMRVLSNKVYWSTLKELGSSFMDDDFKQLMEGEGQASKVQDAKTLQDAEAQIFRQAGCSSAFIDFLCDHLEHRLYRKGQAIEETLAGRALYFLHRGQGQQQPTEEVVQPGIMFGEIEVLGLKTGYKGTIVPTSTCWLKVLHQDVVVRGLELFPEERIKLLRDTDENTLKSLKLSPFFSKMPRGFVERLHNYAIDRIHMPGGSIITEGAEGDSMFTLISGTVGVFVHDRGRSTGQRDLRDETSTQVIQDKEQIRVGTFGAGSVCGELAMLGVSQIRSATLMADTVAYMWEIDQEKCIALMKEFPESKRQFQGIVNEHLERTIPARISPLPLLKGFDRKFRTLLALYCERYVYFPTDVVVKEGQTGSKLFVVNIGMAMLEKKGITIRTYKAGCHFGTTVMLGLHKTYAGTFVALRTCHILAITRNSYMQVLDQYPNKSAHKALRETELKIEEDMRVALERTATRKMIWKKYQESCCGGSSISGKGLTSEEIQREVLSEWRRVAKELFELRLKKETEKRRCDADIQSWISRRKEAMEYAKELRDLQYNTDTSKDGKLPMLTPRGEKFDKTVAATLETGRARPNQERISEAIESLPAAKPSPHYRLRWKDVLREVVGVPSVAEPLLPILLTPTSALAGDGKAKLLTASGGDTSEGWLAASLRQAAEAAEDQTGSSPHEGKSSTAPALSSPAAALPSAALARFTSDGFTLRTPRRQPVARLQPLTARESRASQGKQVAQRHSCYGSPRASSGFAADRRSDQAAAEAASAQYLAAAYPLTVGSAAATPRERRVVADAKTTPLSRPQKELL
eukprot:TRINITY_DN33242_c0_g1_i1.p1 TRINITY_DN33242_c0_g1~~TRINITY_DN33242_c0_g1_i1.p1  ORF type:complete len:1353 (+),score=341.09 TRINITY_DN33242_c0_g1_i1:252-4310(+)